MTTHTKTPEATRASEAEAEAEPSETRPADLDWSTSRPPFSTAFATTMRVLRGVEITASEAEAARENLPPHLHMSFVVVTRSGQETGSGTDLVHLQKTLARSADDAVRHAVRGAVAEALEEAVRGRGSRGKTPRINTEASTLHPEGGATAQEPRTAPSSGDASPPATAQARYHADGLTSFPTEVLPRSIDSPGEHMTLRGFPALVAQGTADAPAAGIRVMANAQEADRHHRDGLARLLLVRLRLADKRVTTRWTGHQALMLAATSYPSTSALVADAQLASALALADELAGRTGPSAIRDAEAFERLAEKARNLHEDRVYEILGHVVRAMEAEGECASALDAHRRAASLNEVVADLISQTRALTACGFVSATPAYALPHLARYLRAGAVRLERASSSARTLRQDLEDMDRIHELVARLDEIRAEADSRPYDGARTATIEHVRWLIEELRVSCFAQRLGTPNKVSFKRVASLIEAAR